MALFPQHFSPHTKKMSAGSNQRTLFQTWGAAVSKTSCVQPQNGDAERPRKPPNTAQVAASHPPRNPLWTKIGQGSTCTTESSGGAKDTVPAFEDEHDDDDDLMLVAVYEAEKSLQCDNSEVFQVGSTAGTGGRALSPSPSGVQTYPDFPGFDSSSAKIWIYPTNYPIREYQLKISEAALFQNTLVCLPTGLGKTFIASVVMYNFYRWYPSGKIVFMAPTKPLVAQQIEACYKVMGIPQAHMAELTGTTGAKQRQEMWRSKRVFFLTPQIMVNDLTRNTCPALQVKCVVIDEAHKALGNHAYCQVIRQLGSQTQQFRILALSATPGGDSKSVQSVISNLLISHIELRSEESPDIRAHSHQRSVEKIVVPLGEALSAQQARYLQVLEKFMLRLITNRVMSHKDLRTLTKYQLILARDQFRKNPPSSIKGGQQGMLEGDFALCISLYHGYELLMQMGLRSLFFYIQGIMDGSREMSRARNELQRTPTFMDLYREMEAMFMKPSAGPDEPFVYSHPKLQKLEHVVQQHFTVWAKTSAGNNGPLEVTTRVMIFSSFRESVQEIAEMLNRHAPLIRVMTFMGQASAGKGVKGFTQKEQLEVVHRFRQGGFNTLVSTCVGEEGLDIGEVDLIVCFDAQKSPIRLVQRMGRTGRKRQGRIVIILAEGREEKIYNQSQSNKRSVYKSILSNKSMFHMYPNSPRMLPEGVKPALHKMHITCGQFDHQENSRLSARGRRSHSEGQRLFIHPQNLIWQGSSKSDGFLSSTEYALWESTMKLKEDEAHPTLKQSHFLSIPADPPPQEGGSKNGPPSRELSLWEWRHWQHKVFPTHVVDHSLRCNHFIKVMELIDSMREENEGECHYEQELLPYLHKADGVAHERNKHKNKGSTKTFTKTINNKPKASHSTLSDLEYLDEEAEGDKPERKTSLVSMLTFTKRRSENDIKAPYENFTDCPGTEEMNPLPSESDSPENGMDEVCAETERENLDKITQLITKTDESEDVELEAMFYLPKWDTAPLPSNFLPGKENSLEVILANVAELLSRSPPSPAADFEADTASVPPPQPLQLHPPYQVSFTLDVDDDDEDDDVVMSDADNASLRKDSYQPPVGEKQSKLYNDLPHQELSSACVAANSPTWDEVFGDEEEEEEPHLRAHSKVADGEMCNNLHGVQTSEEAEKNRDDVENNGMPDLLDEEGKDDNAFQCIPQSDNSMDLFGDDDAFLQMSTLDIPTPAATHQDDQFASDISNSTKNMTNTSQIHDSSDPCCRTHTLGSSHRQRQTDKLVTHTQQTNISNTTKHSPNTKTLSSVMDSSGTNKVFTAQLKSPTLQQNFDVSHEYFSVNFDLGYSLDSEDDTDVEAAPLTSTSPRPKKQTDSLLSLPTISNSSTPYTFTRQRMHTQFSESKSSPAKMFPECSKRERSPLPTSTLVSKSWALPSPITSPGARRTLIPGPAMPHTPSLLSRLKRRHPASPSIEAEGGTDVENKLHQKSVVGCNSDSDDDVVVLKRRHQKVNPLSSPVVSKISSDVDSPLVVNRKHAVALNTSGETEAEAVSDDDFQNESVFRHQTTARGAENKQVQQARTKHTTYKSGRQFLDEEAELSEGADVSSDEEDGEAQNQSLDGFVVDNMHFSQGLNDSEMHGVYLKSVRSPVVHGKFKMSYRKHHVDIFSQVAEMDETYAEDSFVVGNEVEEVESSAEEAEDIELMPEDSYIDGRRQYATRRRVFLHKVRAEAKTTTEAPPTKRNRVLRIEDSSDEGTEEGNKVTSPRKEENVALPLRPKTGQSEPSRPHQQQTGPTSSSSTIASKVSLLSKAQRSSATEEQQNERCRQRLEEQHLLSDELDFVESVSLLSSKNQPQEPSAKSSVSKPQKSTGRDHESIQGQNTSVSEPLAPLGSVSILADSRCISTGVDLMTSLRHRHSATVHVCSLDGSYFIVSNRMAVERHSQSDLAAVQNRKRLAERMSSLQRLFERICLIVERDRSKPGDASRPFQRTRFYDSTIAGLVRTGVHLLWSDGAEESAGLLADIARLEQRKGHAITVPLEVKGQHREQALQLYLGLPSVNYAHALNMSHNFKSIAQLINSSVEAIQKGGCMNQSRAEEIYRALRYSCDSFFLNTSKAGKNS
ncbi:Fanconi anemia group M protein isoform X1 [Echeneis naucrates]|uniref:Fanconi anemia group M protein isoform X1 n=1 Tax=Echeneis naucrates TaxID=173247 RepID=UPI0011135EEB|nr:Fanconi anemia group M protein isoform X1 [Echeneis naucrates]